MKNVLSSAISSARSENAFVGGVCAPGALKSVDVKAEVQRRCRGREGEEEEEERKEETRKKRCRGRGGRGDREESLGATVRDR